MGICQFKIIVSKFQDFYFEKLNLNHVYILIYLLLLLANGNPCIFDLPFVARQYDYVGADINVIMHLLAGFSGDFGVFFGRLC